LAKLGIAKSMPKVRVITSNKRYVIVDSTLHVFIFQSSSQRLISLLSKPEPSAAPTPKPAEPSYDEFRDRPKEQRPSGFNLLANVGTADKSVLTKRVAPVVSTAFKVKKGVVYAL